MSDSFERQEALEFIERVRCRVVALENFVEGMATAGGLLMSEIGTLGLSYILADLDQDLDAAITQLKALGGSETIRLHQNRKEKEEG